MMADKAPDPALACPLCGLTLDPCATCPRCGLAWLSTDVPGTIPAGPDSPPTELRLVLGEPFWCGLYPLALLFLIPTACLGLAAALAVAMDVLLAPARPLNWAWFLLGLPLGGFVAAFCGGYAVSILLETVAPSRLDGADAGLRVRVRSRRGFWASLRRTDTLVPLPKIEAAGVWSGPYNQNERDWRLVVIHDSGMAFETGQRTEKEEALRLGKTLADWIEGARRPR